MVQEQSIVVEVQGEQNTAVAGMEQAVLVPEGHTVAAVAGHIGRTAAVDRTHIAGAAGHIAGVDQTAEAAHTVAHANSGTSTLTVQLAPSTIDHIA